MSAGRGAEEAVAARLWSRNGQRLARLEGLEPEADLAQLDGHRVDVDAVEAAADDVAQRGSDGRRRGLLVAGADGGQALGDPVGGGDEEVAGAARRVDDRQREDRLLGGPVAVGLAQLRRGPGRGPSRAGREIRLGRGVVAAGRLALVAGGGRRA